MATNNKSHKIQTNGKQKIKAHNSDDKMKKVNYNYAESKQSNQ